MKEIADFDFNPENRSLFVQGQQLTKEVFHAKTVKIKDFHTSYLEIFTSIHSRYELSEIHVWQMKTVYIGPAYRRRKYVFSIMRHVNLANITIVKTSGMVCDPHPDRVSWKDVWRVEKDMRRRTIRRRYHDARQRR